MGVLQGAQLRLRHADRAQQFDDPCLARLATQLCVQAQRFGNFLAYRAQRVEGAEGVLHHKADMRTAQGLPGTVVQLAQVGAGKRQAFSLNL